MVTRASYFLIFVVFHYASLIADKHQIYYKMYCMYTPQFEKLFHEFFLPSIKDDFELVVRQYPQDCPLGTFRSDGWDKTMLNKLLLLQDAIQENWNDQIFFYSDIDIIFLKPILAISLDHLADHDFVAQQSWPRDKLCAGFFIMRGNKRTLDLVTTAYRLLYEQICVDDQEALQIALTTFKKEELSWKLLPSEQYPNGRRLLQQRIGHYSENSRITLNDSMLLFHANCCIGLPNKYHFLRRVEEEFYSSSKKQTF